MEGLITLVALVVLITPIMAIIAMVKASELKGRIERIESELRLLRSSGSAAPTRESAASAPARAGATPEATSAPAASSTIASPAAAPPITPAIPNAAPPPIGATTTSDTNDWQVSLPEVTPPAAIASRSAAPAPRIIGATKPATAARAPSAPTPPRTSGPDPITTAIERVKLWFTTGNVPVKVGMLVLLVGVAALLRYANDQGWFTLPIELRLVGVSATALAALGFAWRKRESHRMFAQALQGGAIGVLLLVVFAAYKLYGLIGATPAFAMSVTLVAGLVVLAVLQDSRTLAVLGVFAGFLAPLWLSDGSGNHVALFAYYALLNLGIFAIAWIRPWRILNLLGFVFTWGIGTAWGVLSYVPEKFASTEPFLLLFFAFYLLLPILYARKLENPGAGRIDGCLLFGTPLIAFSLQAGLLEGARTPLSFNALGLAALYAVLAWFLLRAPRLRLLGRAHAILAMGFATLAVPLALSARATAAVFALEGAGLVWLGHTQQRRLAHAAGYLLQLVAGGALLLGIANMHAVDAQAIANASFMGALLIALAGFASAWLERRAGNAALFALAWLWALAWWLGNGVHEITRFVDTGDRLHAILLLLGLTGWLAAEAARSMPSRLLAATTLAVLWLALPIALLLMGLHRHPLAGIGLWAWPVFAVMGWRAITCLREVKGAMPAMTQLAWWLCWPLVLSLEAWYLGQRFELAGGWVAMWLALPWLALFAGALARWPIVRSPLGVAFDDWRGLLMGLVAALLAIWWLLALGESGASAPLPWIPVFNPLELAQLAFLLLLFAWLRGQAPGNGARVLLALAMAVLVTVMTLRGVHHWGGQPWSPSMLSSSLAQTSLSLVWSLFGVAGWILGSRRGLWGVWLAGAILMGVVLAKLLLIDRNNLGDLLGIGAFLAFGLLCTLVGWMAPAPPRRAADAQEAGA